MADPNISSRDKGGFAGAGETRPTPGMKDKIQEEASALVAKGKEAAALAAAKTKGAASSVVQTVEDVASNLGHRAERAVGAVGGEMKSLASTIRGNAPESGVLRTTASGVAGTLESGGTYLQEHNLRGMGEDLTGLIRRYPFQAIVAGMGVGFLVGRAFRS